MNSYSIDPYAISTERFCDLLSAKELLPGRLPLLENMEESFNLLIREGIHSMGDLLKSLNTKQKILLLAGRTGLSNEYLVLLGREARSYLPRPFPLSEFPGVPFEYVEVLKSNGIKNTKSYFESFQSDSQRQPVSVSTGIPLYRMVEILNLCDVSRIGGVGGVFARIMYETGIRSVEAFVKADPEILIRDCNSVISEYKYTSNPLSMDDLVYCLDYAKVIIESQMNQQP